MPFLALVNEQELEFPDAASVRQALLEKRLQPETWIKESETEADWETVEEKFPDWVT